MTAGNLESHVPPDKRQVFVSRYLSDLADDIRVNWTKSVRHFVDAWTSANPSVQPTANSIDLPAVSEWIVDPINEKRRQTKISERLWKALRRGFGPHSSSVASDSVEMHLSSDDEDDEDIATWIWEKLQHCRTWNSNFFKNNYYFT